jgi:hypothetical protein
VPALEEELGERADASGGSHEELFLVQGKGGRKAFRGFA